MRSAGFLSRARLLATRVLGALLWLVPAFWFAVSTVGWLGTLEFGADVGCGNPQLSALLLAVVSWPILWAGSLLAWLVLRAMAGTPAVERERWLRHAWLACPAFAALSIGAYLALSAASTSWFPERGGRELRAPLAPARSP